MKVNRRQTEGTLRNGEDGVRARSEEAQTSTIKHSFQFFGVDYQDSWLNVYICGRNEKTRKEGSVRLEID